MKTNFVRALVLLFSGYLFLGVPPFIRAAATYAEVLALVRAVMKDDSKALAELRVRSEAGEAWCQYHLGMLYKIGECVPKSEVEAEKWFLKSANQGDAEAQEQIGIMHLKGISGVRNEAEALKWFLKSAENENFSVIRKLAAMYDKGEGVVKDQVEAYKWYLLMAAKNDGEARAVANRIEEVLSPRERADGQKRAKELHEQWQQNKKVL